MGMTELAAKVWANEQARIADEARRRIATAKQYKLDDMSPLERSYYNWKELGIRNHGNVRPKVRKAKAQEKAESLTAE